MTEARKHQLQRLYVELTQRVAYNRQRAHFFQTELPDEEGTFFGDDAIEYLDRADRLNGVRAKVTARLSAYGYFI